MNLNALFKFNIGLVLSGGGAKGAYQVGVFKALHELQLHKIINVVSGTSIGALNGALFLMGDPDLYLKAWEKATYDTFMYTEKNKDSKSFLESIRTLLKKDIPLAEVLLKEDIGLFSQKGLAGIIEDYVDFTKIKKDKKLLVCAYNVDSKEPEYFQINDLNAETAKKALLASAAIPFVYDPIEINGRKYLDGGINNPLYGKKNADKVPVKPVYEYGCNIIVVVYLGHNDRLDPSFRDGKTTFIEIYPSEPLEGVRGTGTFDFTKKGIEKRIMLGYRDAMVIIAPLLIKILLGKKFTELVAEHDRYNQELIAEFTH